MQIFERVSEAANNSETLKVILSNVYGVSYTGWNNGNHKDHDGLKIKKLSGTWMVTDFSGSTIGDSDGRGAYALAKKAYNLSEKKDVFEKLQKLTNTTASNFVSSENTYQRAAPAKVIGTTIKKSYKEIVYGSWESEYGKVIENYLSKKLSTLELAYAKRHIKPILTLNKFGKIIHFTRQNFAYSVFEGDTIKIFSPNDTSKTVHKTFLQSVRTNDKLDYLFGLSDIPARCRYIFLVEGENDCMSFNSHLNGLGWYAVTVGGAKMEVRKELINELKKRCETVFCLYDNDKAGEEGTAKIEKEHGIKGIRIGKYVNHKYEYTTHTFSEDGINKTLNDICDCVAAIGIDDLQSIIETEISLLLEVKASPAPAPASEPTTSQPAASSQRAKTYFSAPAYRPKIECTNVHFENYITGEGGNIFEIKASLQTHFKVMLKAFAGAGKGEIAKILASDNEFMTLLGLKRVIVLEPTAILTKQQAKNLQAEMYGDGKKVSKNALKGDSVFIATFDQYNKFTQTFLDESLVIPDEPDMIPSEYGYRKDAMLGVHNLMSNAKYVLGTTATPNLEFCKMFGYHLLNVTCSNDENVQKIKITPHFTEKVSSKDLLPLIYKYHNAEKLNVIEINDKKILSVLEKYVWLRYNKKAVRFTSEEKNTPQYKMLVAMSSVELDVLFALCTKALQAGMSIRNAVQMFMVNPKATREVVQFAARGRFNRDTGVNKEVELHMFFTDFKITDKEAFLKRYKAFQNGELVEMPKELYNHQQRINDHTKQIENLCEIFNNKIIEYKDQPNSQDLEIICVNGVYSVNKLAIIHKFESELQGVLKNDFVAFCAEIQSFNPNISFDDIIFDDCEEDIEVRASMDEMNDKIIESKKSIIELLCNDSERETVLLAAYNEVQNFDQHAAISAELGYTPEKTKETIEGHEKGEVLEMTMKYLDIKSVAKVAQIPIEELHEKLPKIISEKKDKLVYGSIVRIIEMNTPATTNQEGNHYGEVSKKIKGMVKAGDTITKTKMIAIYNQCFNTTNVTNFFERNFEIVKARFDQLFEMDLIVRNSGGGKFITKYQLVREITAANCLDIDTNVAKKERAKASQKAYSESDAGIAAKQAKQEAKPKKTALCRGKKAPKKE